MLKGSLVERAHEAQVRSYYIAGITLLVTIVLGAVNIVLLIANSHGASQVVSPTASHRVPAVANLIPWVAAVGLLIAAGFYVSGAYLLSRARRPVPSTTEASRPAPAPAIAVEDENSPSRRLLRQVEADVRGMADLIHFQPQLAHVEPHFEGHTPFMNLTFAFVNGSPFDIRFDRAEGFVHYRGEPFRTGLMDPTRVSSATAFTEIVIPHGRQNWFRLRQWLDLLPARMLAEEVGRSGTAVLETQALAICFTYVDSYTTGGTNERREVRVGIPGTPFRIAGA